MLLIFACQLEPTIIVIWAAYIKLVVPFNVISECDDNLECPIIITLCLVTS